MAGDVRGRLGRLYQRATAINKDHGPFACIFCVGEFFPAETPQVGARGAVGRAGRCSGRLRLAPP